ncbi:MAG: glycosyltransferase [Actinomycetales bacterium]|nr:glycosyltransferase [Actinomycetales bacterium]
MPDDATERSAAPLTILIGCDTFSPDVNGAASFARQLAVGMVQRGHRVEVVAPAPTGVRAGTYREHHGGVEFTVHRLYSWRWLPHPWLRFALPWRAKANARRIVDAVKPGVIHFQSHIVIGRGLAMVAKERGIRLIGTNHVMPENIVQHVRILPRRTLDWLVRVQWRDAGRWFGAADAVTSPTRRSADYLEHNTGLRGTHAISNGIVLGNYRQDFTPRERNRIVFLGRIDEEKHVDELVHAVARLDPALDVEVDILGDGDQRAAVRQLVEKLGLADRIRVPGKVSYDVLRETLTRASVFAMPSTAELQSITTMEAMASALPVVAADAVALPHLVQNGVNGYLYTPHDVRALADRLTDVLTAPWEEQERMKRASLAKVQVHDLEHALDAFEAIYRGLDIPDPVTD